MQHFYIMTNEIKDADGSVTASIVEFLTLRGATCTLEPAPIPRDCDCILVLGGDGTLLRAASDTMEHDIPLLGINLGTLGFMAEVEKQHITTALTALLEGRYHVEERMMLEGAITRETTATPSRAMATTPDQPNLTDVPQNQSQYHSLNDIVLTRSGSLKILAYDVYVNGQFLNRFHADGVIISTPTGSTGYNLSAGGPIVEPTAKIILLTPICPHTMGARSMVLSPEDTIEIRIEEGRNGELQQVEANFDGTKTTPLVTGDKIVIKTSDQVTRLIRLSKVSFLEVLHKKLSE